MTQSTINEINQETRIVKAISMPKATIDTINEFCEERGARIGQVIEAVLEYWIENEVIMETAIHTETAKKNRAEGRNKTDNFRVRLLPSLMARYEAKRIKERVSDDDGIPFGASIGCLWLEWWVNEGEKFVPTPKPSNKGKQYKRKGN